MKSDVEAKDEAVSRALEGYAASLRAMDTELAANRAEELTELDCGVCTQIGQHLTALAVALSTAPVPSAEAEVREMAIQRAERLRDELV